MVRTTRQPAPVASRDNSLPLCPGILMKRKFIAGGVRQLHMTLRDSIRCSVLDKHVTSTNKKITLGQMLEIGGMKVIEIVSWIHLIVKRG